jgi:hypothetical protein
MEVRLSFAAAEKKPLHWPCRLGEKNVKGLLVLTAALAIALVISSSALANSANCGHSATSCSAGQQGGPAGNSTSKGQGTLPFTGFDLAGISGIGLVLLASGLTLQRVGRRRQQ